MRFHRFCPAICFLAFAFTRVCGADEPLAKAVQDNSFFIEEAYNQEDGVVQHIFNLPVFFHGNNKQSSPNFTQEWPFFGQLHQLSYTVPYTFLSGDESGSNFGDIRLNYRLQALTETEKQPAFAPRLTLVLPTGGDKFGHDVPGYEMNLPFSKIVSDRWTLHANLGGNVFPDENGRNPMSYLVGGSAIYAVNRNLNFMLEYVSTWDEDVSNRGKIDRTFTAVISPGARYAFNLPHQAQLVIGAAVPVGISADAPEVGMFFYFSFEHPFTKAAEAALTR